MQNSFQATAEFSLRRSVSEMPEAARKWAALLLLDTLGIAVASGPMEAGVIARDTAAALYGSDAPNMRARMLMDGRAVSLAGAAYAIATQTDNLDAHDGFNPNKGHIGCAVVPALLALAQQQNDLSGIDALGALIVGYEVAGRAGLGLHGTACDYHTSGAWNALGVVALGARLRGLGDAQFRHALGIAEYHGPRSQMMREIANPTMLHDGSGWGAMAGISALVLAERGFTGAPAITLEGDDVALHWSDLGTRWIMTEQYVKPYPICRWAHAPIDAVRALKAAHGFTHSDVASVQINTFAESACLFGGMPETTSQAQYSLGFALAQMLVAGQIGLAQISGDGLKDARVKAMLEKTEVVISEQHNALFPQHRTADVIVTLNDGRVLESGLVHARGGAEEPFSAEDIQEKFFSFASPVVGDARAKEICAAVMGLSEPNARFDDLAALLYEPA
ncbi:MAG: MmgE/PrpD family protein [Planktotalea sp.]|uniref:MmgE/PrpD family protein n=1 Tax=Planktotalea sp. TaxID=2029877 RepID=UPI003C72F109